MLQLQGVSKRFDDRLVLDDVGFTIGPGRMTGFVGGNGAGKTTTMRIILGVLEPDAGSVTFDGRPVTTPDRRRFGYMPEERGLYPKMRVREQLVYLARLHGWDAAAAHASATDLLDRLGLGDRADDAVETLSLGNQQRAQIAAALVHEPELLVLDEPFSGLDPMAVEAVQQVLHEYAAGGVPVLFSSHQLDIVERLCDDLVVIAGGRIRAAGPREELRDRYSAPVWELVVDDASWIKDWLGGSGSVVSAEAGVVQLEAAEDVRRRLLAEAAGRGPVHSWRRVQPTLTEIFREVVR